MPRRGWNIFLSDGMRPSDGNVTAPLEVVTVESIHGAKNTVAGGVIGLGSICASQRRPELSVSPADGFHVSCRNPANSFCVMVWVPASFVVTEPTPDPWRYRMTGPTGTESDAGHLNIGYTPLVPSEHSM